MLIFTLGVVILISDIFIQMNVTLYCRESRCIDFVMQFSDQEDVYNKVHIIVSDDRINDNFLQILVRDLHSL